MTNDRQISRFLQAAKVALVVALLYAVVEAARAPFRLDTAFKPNTVAGKEAIRSRVAIAADDESPTNYSVIVKNNVFAGGPATANPGSSPAVGPMPSAEELGLRLIGVIAGGPVASRAIIESRDRTAQPYKIGDAVGSTTIESIEPGRVILRHAGQRRALLLHTATTTEDLTESTEDNRPMADGREGLPIAGERSPQASARLGYVEDLFRKATIEPCIESGQADGLRITGLEQTPLTTMFGLRNGDIVRTINGQCLTSKQKAFQVLKKARTQPKLDVQIVRDGETRDLSFDL